MQAELPIVSSNFVKNPNKINCQEIDEFLNNNNMNCYYEIFDKFLKQIISHKINEYKVYKLSVNKLVYYKTISNQFIKIITVDSNNVNVYSNFEHATIINNNNNITDKLTNIKIIDLTENNNINKYDLYCNFIISAANPNTIMAVGFDCNKNIIVTYCNEDNKIIYLN